VPSPNAPTPNAPAARGTAAPAGPGGGGRGAGGPAIAGGRGGGDNVFAISSGGMVHVMNPQIGTDQMPPVKFLPPNAKVVGSILVDNVLYAATTGNCGGAPNGVWAVDLVTDGNAITSWDAQGAGIVGAVAPTFGSDSTVYVATGGGGSPTSNAVIALEPKTLKLKSWFSPGATSFTSAPVVFPHGGKDVVAVANKDGRIYLLDGAAIGGADHMTALAKSAPLSTAAGEIGSLATWVDAAGTRWVGAAVTGGVHADTKFPMANGAAAKGTIAAFTVVDQNGAPTLQPQWSSRDLAAPVTPAVVNGVVFAVASGDAAGQRSSPAVLYALDATTGKELWTSGTTITSSVRGVGPSAGDSQVYVVTGDGTLYAFGMPAER
jgi:putative pyrroloquinoline-quinone binding quinoprotein